MTTDHSTEAFILVTVASTHYAVRSRDVEHVEMVESVTPVPHAPPFVDGVVFSRGHVVPVVNLRARFGLERAPIDVRTRLLVVARGERHIGLLVDGAREFVTIPASALEPPPEDITGMGAGFLEGVGRIGERLVLVLDLAALLAIAPVGEAGSALPPALARPEEETRHGEDSST